MPSNQSALADQATRRSHAERTDESDRLMLDAAVELINERGPDGTTLKEVGERAGYSRGLAGYRFGSKQGLFEFVVRSVGEDWLARLTEVTQGLRGIAALQAAVQAHSQMCLENSAAIRAFYMLWLASVSPGAETLKIIQGIDHRRRQDVATWVREARNASQADVGLNELDIADQFSAAIIGIAYHWLSQPADHERVQQHHDQLVHTMSLLIVGSQHHRSD